MRKISCTEKQKNEAFRQLNVLYGQLPRTQGCMENLKSCGGWCCRIQSPSLLYSEFLHTWKWVLNNLSLDDIVSLVEKSLIAYLSEMVTKGCIFFDDEDCNCIQHPTRPLACRMYGIVPSEEFERRMEALKNKLTDPSKAIIRPQCNKVSPINREKPTQQDADKWWRELVKIEKSIGVAAEDINDKQGGTYRTFHDHILLHLMPDEVLLKLSQLRTIGTVETKQDAIFSLTKALRSVLASAMKDANERD